MWVHGFRCYFTPLSGCFSPFPHGTGSLSVTGEYLALEGGPPGFAPGFTCPALLGNREQGGGGFAYGALTRFGRPFHAVPLPAPFLTLPEVSGPPGSRPRNPHAATPRGLHTHGFGLGARSLAATSAVSFDFLSSGYLDVSVPPVASAHPMCSGAGSGA